jgi:hypothetical protein
VAPYLVLLAFLLVGLAVYAARRRARRQADQAMDALGLEPIEPIPARLLRLWPGSAGDGGPRVEWVRRHPAPAADVYVAQTARSVESGDSQHTKREREVVVWAPARLRLPEMQLIPKAATQLEELGGDGLVARLARAAAAAADEASGRLAASAGRLEFADDPEFERRFFVMGKDASAVRAVLDPERRRALCGLGGVTIQGDGDLAVVRRPGDEVLHRSEKLEARLRRERDLGLQVLEILS